MKYSVTFIVPDNMLVWLKQNVAKMKNEPNNDNVRLNLLFFDLYSCSAFYFGLLFNAAAINPYIPPNKYTKIVP